MNHIQYIIVLFVLAIVHCLF